MPAPTYNVGELVTYYPRRLNSDDNRHWPAVVLDVRRGRYLVEIDAPLQPVRRLVTWRRLARQAELLR